MARLPYLEPDQVAPEYRDMLKRNTNLHKLLVNSPDMARAFNDVGNFIRFKSKLDPRLRELAILQVGWLERSEYEFTHHVKIGKEFGVTDEDIKGLFAETEGKPSKLEPLAKAIDTPLQVVTPAFMISELKRAFEIGFLLFVPFLVIDLVVASVLMSMGMMMLPPVVVSLPFKLIFFVLVDGWRLVCGSLVESFHRVTGSG